MLNELIKKNKNISFHMPGHNKGKGLSKKFKRNILKIDTTEVLDNDNLHFPSGIIKNAQDKLSKVFGSHESFFLVNGSSSGILSAIGGVFNKGDTILLGRDSHQSVFHSIELFELKPVYINPEIHIETGIPMGYKIKDIDLALEKNEKIKGVFLTSPNYFGIVSELREIADLTKKFNLPLIIDEAHGGHLKFNKQLPKSGVESGADIVIQSTHKTLCGMNQGAYLHIMTERIDLEKIKHYMRVFQTTSPSYPIMTSLDETTNILMKTAESKIERLIKIIENFSEKINTIKGIQILTEKNFIGYKKDILRIVIETKYNISANEILKILSNKFSIDIECANNNCLILIPSLFQKKKDFKKLYRALKKITSKLETDLNKGVINTFNEETKTALNDLVGKLAKDYIIPFPPGIPLLVPGEIIDDRVIKHILDLKNKGCVVNGLLKGYNINIIKDKKGDCMKKGLFITFEGMDGSGKSTQINLLKEYLENIGQEVVLTREPGGTKIGEKIRDILLDMESIGMKEETEILLYAAARAQIVRELILPEINKGKTVICDRYYDSSFAYQGYGRKMSLDMIKSANSYAINEAKPDLTILVDISPEKARKRIENREIDRLEMEKMDFHNRVYKGFKILAENEPDRIKIVNADRTVNEIFEDIKVIVLALK